LSFKIKCLECGAVLESKSRHDFVMCECPNQAFADGGGEDYCRYGAADLSKIAILNKDDRWVVASPGYNWKCWSCKIVVDEKTLPEAFDAVPRRAAIEAVEKSGIKVIACFSGWGGKLTDDEKEVIKREIEVYNDGSYSL